MKDPSLVAERAERCKQWREVLRKWDARFKLRPPGDALILDWLHLRDCRNLSIRALNCLGNLCDSTAAERLKLWGITMERPTIACLVGLQAHKLLMIKDLGRDTLLEISTILWDQYPQLRHTEIVLYHRMPPQLQKEIWQAARRLERSRCHK